VCLYFFYGIDLKKDIFRAIAFFILKKFGCFVEPVVFSREANVKIRVFDENKFLQNCKNKAEIFAILQKYGFMKKIKLKIFAKLQK
jgi:hypothetical protein